MNNLYLYFRKVKKELKVLFFFSIVLYFIIELWLRNYPELFHGAGKVGDFFSRLSLSYISAFIFYFLVVHIKSQKDKENINEFVGHEVYQIITCGHLLIQPLQQKFNKDHTFKDLKFAELNNLLASIDRTAREAPFKIGRAHV